MLLTTQCIDRIIRTRDVSAPIYHLELKVVSAAAQEHPSRFRPTVLARENCFGSCQSCGIVQPLVPRGDRYME
jgi:hypothetical protein